MRLAYFHYGGEGLARIVLYGVPTELQTTISSVHYLDKQFHTEKPRSFAYSTLVSSPFVAHHGFSLTSTNGQCLGEFTREGLVISQKTGALAALPKAIPLIEKRTIEVPDCPNSIALPRTDIVLLSQVWSGFYVTVKIDLPEDVPADQSKPRQRVTGWSAGGACEASCALIATISPDTHKTGFLLWGGNEGIRLGGAHGQGQPVMFFNSTDYFPQKVRDVIGLAPSAAQINNPISLVGSDC